MSQSRQSEHSMRLPVAKWMRVCVLGAALVFQPVGIPVLPLAAGTVAGVVMLPSDADARSRSSGGYSRPSSSRSSSSSFSSSSRTPSASSSSSSSGGYSRPSASSSSSTASAPSSAGDKALSRQSSSSALDTYRQKKQEDRTPSAASSSSGSWSFGSDRSPSGFQYQIPRSRYDYYQSYGWAPPPYMYSAPRSFGMWDAVFMWYMLDTLTRPGHSSFFHNNQYDPGYQQWRAEADRLAKDNADLRSKLEKLDGELATQNGLPREAGKLPPDVPKDMVTASASGGFGWLFWVVVISGVLILFWLWRVRRRRDRLQNAAVSPVEPPSDKEKPSVPLFGTLGNYVDRKLSGKAYAPSLFRVGMTVTVEPTPFVLAGDRIKAKAPQAGLISVQSVGTITAGTATVYRLYLSDDQFVQIHLDREGLPDECRYFNVIDEVTPADADEWGFWLDEADGMIGWSEFETKDGKVYARAWSPGLTRIEPFELKESIAAVRGSSSAVNRSMLYSATTTAAAPAPQTEYILVSAVEREGQAWVQIAAGIDINPASLSLA